MASKDWVHIANPIPLYDIRFTLFNRSGYNSKLSSFSKSYPSFSSEWCILRTSLATLGPARDVALMELVSLVVGALVPHGVRSRFVESVSSDECGDSGEGIAGFGRDLEVRSLPLFTLLVPKLRFGAKEEFVSRAVSVGRKRLE